MRIDNLKFGTKLMWDADPNQYLDPPKNTQRFIYPAIVGIKHPKNQWVMVYTGMNGNWMGPFEDNLREPTEEELKTLEWPTGKHYI